VQIFEMLFLLSNILLFIPCLLLSLLYLIETRKKEGQERRTALFGLVTFTLLAIVYAMWTVSVYFNILLGFPIPGFGGTAYATTSVAFFGAAIILLACWTLAISRPEWLHERKLILAIAGFILWVIFLGSYLYLEFFFNPNTHFVTSTVFLTIVFIFAFAVVLLKATTEKTAFILFAGLLFFYIGLVIPDIPNVYLLNTGLIANIGVWLILIWYIVTRRQ